MPTYPMAAAADVWRRVTLDRSGSRAALIPSQGACDILYPLDILRWSTSSDFDGASHTEHAVEFLFAQD
jgi:hypothetical protein